MEIQWYTMVEIEISPAIFQRKLQNDEIQMMKNLVGGDWNHGIWIDFPFSWECHHPNWL